jgi:RimJ/RimL family protein N-acetyltransferase
MIQIVKLQRKHYEELFELTKKIEPFEGFQYYDRFCQQMGLRNGFVYIKDGILVGSITFSDYIPGNQAYIHAVFSLKGAMNRKIIKHCFNYAFNILLLHRLVTVIIPGFTDNVTKFIEGIGFVFEGRQREALEMGDEWVDILEYAMLKRECRWI